MNIKLNDIFFLLVFLFLALSISDFLELEERLKIIFIAMFLLATFFLKFYSKKLIEKNKTLSIEKELSDLFLDLSLYPNTSLISAIKKISENKPKVNSIFQASIYDEISQCVVRIENGMVFNEAINYLKKYKSEKINQAIAILKTAYFSGGNFSTIFRDYAMNLKENESIIKSRNAATIIEKYTIFLAAVLFVPGLLGISVYLSDSFDMSIASEMGIGVSQASYIEIKDTSIFATTLYLFEFSALAAFFLSMQSNKLHYILLYFFIISPIAYLVFSNIHIFL